MTDSAVSTSTAERPTDAEPANTNVGFIGLGSQGGPMARRIVESGIPTTLWARRPESLEQFADTSACIADSPATLGAASDLVCVCVVNDAGVEEVLTGEDGVLSGMAPGGVIAIHSTVHPDTCLRLAQEASARGIDLVDAPVSGGGPAAAAGNLLVMMGGDEAVVERIRSVVATYANPIVHLGAVGAGQVAKLLNNTLLAANMAVAAGVLDVGADLGVDRLRLADVMANGSGGSFGLTVIRGSQGDLASMVGEAGALLRKDVGLLAQLAGAVDADEGLIWEAADDALRRMRSPRS